jgi:hypothetical protein
MPSSRTVQRGLAHGSGKVLKKLRWPRAVGGPRSAAAVVVVVAAAERGLGRLRARRGAGAGCEMRVKPSI